MKTFSMTDMGQKRKVNQDFVYTSEKPVGNLPNLFIVADGMGGHAAGDYASRFTTETVVSDISDSHEQNPIRLIRHAYETANAAIIEEARRLPDHEGMGTTLVVATIIDEYLYVANVGDSRLYVIDDRISQITRDHSLVEEMVRAGELDESAARVHPMKNKITRAIGGDYDIRVDFFDMKLNPEDKILMCTDGLTNMVEDEEIRMTVKSSPDVVSAVQRLIDRANGNGGYDNIGIVLIEPFARD
ncbi:MAG: Stp1/IreP family PP2C-type Ser/Thr phosphatase [Lachnospiraceae bacterium]|nr:Stp1/IreP family PP2C-type Ser/Thr phosphatase [Lachnospiraceae bacterium]MBR1523467.1 Stp1/IreP family PP2C-type Ser/Thr phosphatase [Lachnospiraceae bacterium]